MSQDINKAELVTLLATREREVFDCIVAGMRTKEIGDKLNIKANTDPSAKRFDKCRRPYQYLKFDPTVKFIVSLID